MLEARAIEKYGYRRDLWDGRDFWFKPRVAVAQLPPVIDLRQWCCPVMDQGRAGSCTANGITAALRFLHFKQKMPDFPMSRLQLYFDERKLEGTTGSDAGAAIRDGIKCAVKIGVAHESLWPYDLSKLFVQPTPDVYADAHKYEAITYQRVAVAATTLTQALATGYPVIIGIQVFRGFESEQATLTGVIPMPGKLDSAISGHCMLVVGKGQKKGYFTAQNSWSAKWGDKGFCYLPEAYVGDPRFGGDYWQITAEKM